MLPILGCEPNGWLGHLNSSVIPIDHPLSMGSGPRAGYGSRQMLRNSPPVCTCLEEPMVCLMTLYKTMLSSRVQCRRPVEETPCLREIILQAVAFQTTHRSVHNSQGSDSVMQSHEV